MIIICTAYPAEIVALNYFNVFIDKGTRDYEIKSKIYTNDIYLTTIIKTIIWSTHVLNVADTWNTVLLNESTSKVLSYESTSKAAQIQLPNLHKQTKAYHFQRTLSKKISLPRMKGQISTTIFFIRKRKKKFLWKRIIYNTTTDRPRSALERKKKKKGRQAAKTKSRLLSNQ